jgi:hypothetical protein
VPEGFVAVLAESSIVVSCDYDAPAVQNTKLRLSLIHPMSARGVSVLGAGDHSTGSPARECLSSSWFPRPKQRRRAEQQAHNSVRLLLGAHCRQGRGRPMQFRGGLGLAFGALNQSQPSDALAPLRITLTAAVIAACWAGCSAARVTQPLPVGPDTYTLSARTPHGGTSSARDAALSAANQQCARLSKQLLVLKSSGNIDLNENNDIVNDVVDVTFRCLAAGDPELHRPNSQPTPVR